MSLTESVEKRGIGLNLTKQCCSGDKFTLKKLYSQVNQVYARIVVIKNLLNEADHRPELCPELMNLGIFYLFKVDAIKPMKDQEMWAQNYRKCCSFCELSIELWISLNAKFQIQSFILTLFWSVWASMLFILRHRKFKLIR